MTIFRKSKSSHIQTAVLQYAYQINSACVLHTGDFLNQVIDIFDDFVVISVSRFRKCSRLLSTDLPLLNTDFLPRLSQTTASQYSLQPFFIHSLNRSLLIHPICPLSRTVHPLQHRSGRIATVLMYLRRLIIPRQDHQGEAAAAATAAAYITSRAQSHFPASLSPSPSQLSCERITHRLRGRKPCHRA